MNSLPRFENASHCPMDSRTAKSPLNMALIRFRLLAGMALTWLAFSPDSAWTARVRCSDFGLSEQVLDAYLSGATYLDRDGDCYACEKQFNVYVCGAPRSRASAEQKRHLLRERSDR